MNDLVRLSTVLTALVCLTVACSDKKKAQPEETSASMLNMKSSPMEDCPSVSGTYLCSDQSEPIRLILTRRNDNSLHFSYIETPTDNEERLLGKAIENYIFDEGGFLVNGQVQDKASVARELSRGVLDPHIVEMMRLGYVSHCSQNALKVHFVAGAEAFKLAISKNEDGSITQTSFQLDENGLIKKESGRCQIKNEGTSPTTPQNSPSPALSGGNSSSPVQPNASPEIADYPSEVRVELKEKGTAVFGEPISIKFNRYGRFFSRHLYTFNKSFIGTTDNRSFFWWQQGDDIVWETPWKVLSIDMKSRSVFGGTDAGSGSRIGNLVFDGQSFQIELLVDYTIDKEKQSITVLKSTQSPALSSTSCPTVVSMANLCGIYVGTYDTLSAFDYSAVGEAGPAIAKDVASMSTAFKLAKSAMTFKGEIEQIRTQYLVPALNMIGQLKALKRADQKNRAAYIDQTTKVYSNMIVTTVDTLLKTQKLIPEAIEDHLKKTALGMSLQYIGLGRVGGDQLANQPRWVSDLLTPLVIKSTKLYADVLFNSSQTPLATRIDQIFTLEEDLRIIIKRLCDSSPTDGKNECLAALNQ